MPEPDDAADLIDSNCFRSNRDVRHCLVVSDAFPDVLRLNVRVCFPEVPFATDACEKISDLL